MTKKVKGREPAPPMKPSEALLAIRHRFEPGGDGLLICWALWNLKTSLPQRADVASACDRVVNRIRRLLHPHVCLRDWLIAQGVPVDRAHGRVLADKMRATRLAWIDDLIRYYQRRGQ